MVDEGEEHKGNLVFDGILTRFHSTQIRLVESLLNKDQLI